MTVNTHYVFPHDRVVFRRVSKFIFATHWRYVGRGGLNDPGFESRQEQEIFLCSKTPRPAPESIHLHVQRMPEFLFRSKAAWGEVDLSLPSNAEVKNVWSCTFASPIGLQR